MSLYFELIGKEPLTSYALCDASGIILETNAPSVYGFAVGKPLYSESSDASNAFLCYCAGEFDGGGVFTSPVPAFCDILVCECITRFSKTFTLAELSRISTNEESIGAGKHVFDVCDLSRLVFEKTAGAGASYVRRCGDGEGIMCGNVLKTVRLICDACKLVSLLAERGTLFAQNVKVPSRGGGAAALDITCTLRFETDMPTRSFVGVDALAQYFPALGGEAQMVAQEALLLGFEVTFGYTRASNTFRLTVVFDRTLTDPDELKFRERLGVSAGVVENYIETVSSDREQ